MTHSSRYFYGNEVSAYGLEHGFVDYATLAKSFQAVLNNNIISATSEIGYWESENDFYYEDSEGNWYTPEDAEEKRDEIRERIEELESLEESDEIREQIDTLNEELETLEEEHFHDIFQYYIVSDNAVEILRDAGEVLFYNDALDLYVWGVTHWGTSWDYVLTNIKLEIE